MRKLALLTVATLIAVLVPLPAHALPPPIWTHGAADRLFPGTTRPTGAPTSINLYAARNETEAAQIAIRPTAAVSGVSVDPGTLTGPGGAVIPASEITVRREYLHPDVTFFDGAEVQPAPDGQKGYYDALVENTPRSLAANVTQPYHYSVHVPAGQQPGVYTGTAIVRSSVGETAVPVSVTVYPSTLPPTSQSNFKMNNWTTSAGWDYTGTIQAIPLQYGVKMYDANWWKVIENIARDHARHRNNVVFADFQALLIPDTTIDAQGNYNFKWDTFDRFVKTYADAGAMQWIYTPHLLEPNNANTTPMLETLKRAPDGSTQMVHLLPDTAESNAYLDKVFPALKAHLDAMGWTDKFYMSAMDEANVPAETTASNWLYAKYRQYFPHPLLNEAEITRLDPAANVTANTPIMDLYENNVGYYQSKRLAGNELWLYNCSGPRETYLNRFIGSYLDKTRLTPLLAWKTNATGYLHWGWNVWYSEDGVKIDTFDGAQNGDSFLVRPNAAAYDIYDSLRSETQLDGIEDYELFTQLAAIKPVLAKALANSLLTNSYTAEESGTEVDNVHRQVLDALATGGPDQAYPYSDDFSAGSTSWQAGRGAWSSSGGVLSQTDTTGWNFVDGLEARAYGDVAASVDLRTAGVNANGGNTNWAGLVVRNLNSTDFDSGYLVAQRNNGEVFVYRSGTTLGHAMASGYVPGQFNRLRVVARGNTITVYAGSGQAPVLTVTDPLNAFTSGGIGLASGGVNAQFDNVRLNPETNPAEGRPVTVSSSYDNDGWNPRAAVDGRRTSVPGSMGWSSAAASSATDPQTFQLDLGSARSLSRVDLYPRSDGSNAGSGFPVDFTIEVSADGASWSKVADRQGYARPAAVAQTFPFPAQDVRFVRVTGKTLSKDDHNDYRMQFAEVEVAGGNLAAGRTVSSSTSSEYVNEGWLRSNLTDGSHQSRLWNAMGWTSESVAADKPQYARVDLGGPSLISSVDLYARSDGDATGRGYPIDFTVETSMDGTTFTPVASETFHSMPGSEAQKYTFPATTARYVQVRATKLWPDGEGGYRMQLAELEVR